MVLLVLLLSLLLLVVLVLLLLLLLLLLPFSRLLLLLLSLKVLPFVIDFASNLVAVDMFDPVFSLMQSAKLAHVMPKGKIVAAALSQRCFHLRQKVAADTEALAAAKKEVCACAPTLRHRFFVLRACFAWLCLRKGMGRSKGMC